MSNCQPSSLLTYVLMSHGNHFLLNIMKAKNSPRYATLPNIMKAKKKPLQKKKLSDYGVELNTQTEILEARYLHLYSRPDMSNCRSQSLQCAKRVVSSLMCRNSSQSCARRVSSHRVHVAFQIKIFTRSSLDSNSVVLRPRLQRLPLIVIRVTNLCI